jgi:hypothetical protein
MALNERWDLAAMRAGGSVALVFAVPLSVAARILAGDDTPEGTKATIVVLLSLGAAVGFLLGSGVAAWHQQRGTPLSHGIVTAAVTYIVPQAVLIVIKLARGGEVRWTGVIFNLTLVISVGVLGGMLGSSMRKRGARPSGQR